jgi:membrane protease YdiL (CAAX protease family)
MLMENSKSIEHSDLETRAINSQGLNRKGSYLVCLIITFAAVYSQYLGIHFGLILGAFIVYGIPVLAITFLWGTTIIRRFFNNTKSALKFGFASFGAFTVLGIVLAIVILFFLILFNPNTVNLLNRPNPVLDVSPELARIMIGVSLLVVGPAEEYIFRGFMFGGLLDIFKNRHWLTLAFVSSLLFAAVHLYYALVYEAASLIQFTDLVTFGMSMAVTYYLSGGNLFVPALIHGVYDATAFIGVATSMNVGVFLREFLILFSIIVAIVVLVQTRSKRDKEFGVGDKTSARALILTSPQLHQRRQNRMQSRNI